METEWSLNSNSNTKTQPITLEFGNGCNECTGYQSDKWLMNENRCCVYLNADEHEHWTHSSQTHCLIWRSISFSDCLAKHIHIYIYMLFYWSSYRNCATALCKHHYYGCMVSLSFSYLKQFSHFRFIYHCLSIPLAQHSLYSAMLPYI